MRISYSQGLELLEKASLEELQKEAQKIRNQKNPPSRVTFVLDSNPNYTNVCQADCSFCAFYRKKNAKDAYTKTISQVMDHLKFAKKAGLTTVLLQGGLHPDLSLDYYVELVKQAVEKYPEINPHFFSAPEIYNCAKVSKISIKDVLESLYRAGQRSLPGGGAEILSETVRGKISPKKMEKGEWIRIHKTAHRIGFVSTATMMYGHIESAEDIMQHLEVLRKTQDETRGFTAFIPWSYKIYKTALRRSVKNWAGKNAYFKILALSRIYLDNFPHIQASWFSEGKEIGMEALNYGADDFGGTILEENVHRATNFINKTDHQHLVDMIWEAGFTPAQRNTFYKILRNYQRGEKIQVPKEGKIREKDQTPILASFTDNKNILGQAHA